MQTTLAMNNNAAASSYDRSFLQGRRDGWQALQPGAAAHEPVFVLALTGRDSFFATTSPLRGKMDGEVRVMLANPGGEGLRRRVAKLGRSASLESLQRDIHESIAYLADLRRLGERVSLKLYDEEPFWKVIVVGEHIWVRDCHARVRELREREYEFTRARQSAEHASYAPFFMHFLDLWNRYAEYDFGAEQRVRRDARAPLRRRSAP